MHRYIPLPFQAEHFAVAAAGKVTVAKKAVAAEVDLGTGTVTSKPREASRLPAMNDAVALAGLEEQLVDGPRDRMTRLKTRDGHVFQFTGTWEFMARDGDTLVGIVSTTRLRYDCLAIAIGARKSLRLRGSSEAKVAAQGALAGCVTIDTLHVFRTTPTALHSVSISIPPTSYPDLTIQDGRLCVLAGDKILIVDPEQLPLSELHTTAPVEYEPLIGRGQGDPQPAKVVGVLSGKILADHPRLKRLTLSRPPTSPDVARGDSVLIDDVREELPGIYRVYAWHKQGTGSSMRPPPPILDFAAPNVRPIAENEL